MKKWFALVAVALVAGGGVSVYLVLRGDKYTAENRYVEAFETNIGSRMLHFRNTVEADPDEVVPEANHLSFYYGPEAEAYYAEPDWQQMGRRAEAFAGRVNAKLKAGVKLVKYRLVKAKYVCPMN